MLKSVFVCNSCEKEGHGESWGTLTAVPEGWYTLKKEHGEFHFCSMECVARWSQKQVTYPVDKALENAPDDDEGPFTTEELKRELDLE